MTLPVYVLLFAVAALNYPVMGSAPAPRDLTPGVREALEHLKEGGWDKKDPAIVLDIAHQRLLLLEEGQVSHAWRVSTSKYGVGSVPGSYKTPVGLHRIWKKSGASARLGQPLKNGEPTDAPVAEPGERKKVYISTRAMMLDGLEEGTDLLAVSEGRISVTPVHLDMTAHAFMERLRTWNLDSSFSHTPAPTA